MVLRRYVAHRRRDERGAVAVLVAVLSSVMLMVSGLVVDLGMVWSERAQAQNAADASALAAGNVLYADGTGVPDIPGAVAEAKFYALHNFHVALDAWAGCADDGHLAYAPDTPCISFDDQTRPSEVRVRIPRRTVPSIFAGLAGVNHFDIAAGATAGLDAGAVVRCALCVIGEGDHNLINGDVTVTNSSVHLNGSVATNAQGHLVTTGDGQEITVEGTASGNFSPAAVTDGVAMGDPLAGLALPTSFTGMPRPADPCVGGPGVYGAQTFANGTCSLKPGLYVVTGLWKMTNNTQLNGTGISIYASCGTAATPRACSTAGEAGGQFDGSNGAMNLSAGAPELPGVVIAYDRHNTSQVAVQGNGDASLVGTVYAPSSQLYANGNSGHGISGGSIVVKDLYLNGNTSTLRLSNAIEQEWKIPPSNLRLTQ